MSAHDIQAEQIEAKPTLHHVDAPVGDQLVEEIDKALEKGQPVQMKSSLDKLSVWQALKAYKRVSALCMFAAFSASLDGYRKPLVTSPCSTFLIKQRSTLTARSSPTKAL